MSTVPDVALAPLHRGIRALVACLAGTLVAAASCTSRERDAGREGTRTESKASQERLEARVRPTGDRTHYPSGDPGVHTLRAGSGGLLYVPARDRADQSLPLAVVLHGAGSEPAAGLAPLGPLADEVGVILLAPRSRERTWDAIGGGHGADVTSIDALLAEVFDRYSIDPERLAIGGFSDGASYALSLGLANGDLFTHVLAFSPGFIPPAGRRGRPVVYIAHGVSDPVLPIGRTSRRIVPSLRRGGYPVDYREFEGGHSVPADVAREALERFLRPLRR